MLRKIGRAFAWTILSVLLVTVAAVIGLVLWGRTTSGKRVILAKVLPLVQASLNGRLTIGRLEGDLTHGLVLRDVELRDPEDQVAVRVARLAVRYDLYGLLHHAVRVDDLTAEGAFVHARYLKDGRLNLAALVKEAEPKPPAGRPLDLLVRRARADAEVRFEPKTGDEPGPVRGVLHLDGRAAKVGDRLDVTLADLTLDTSLPLTASLKVHGGLHDEPGAPELKDLTLSLRTDGPDLARVAPGATHLRGAWKAQVHADGKLPGVSLDVEVTPPKGTLAVKGVVGLTPRGKLSWNGTVRASGIDPGAAWAGAPHGNVELDASGRGENGVGDVEVARFAADLAGAHAHAHGKVQLGPALYASGAVDVEAKDLSKLATAGVPGLSGSLLLHGRIDRTPQHLHVDADLHALRLGLAAARVQRLDARVHALDLQGSALVSARGIDLPGAGALRFDTLDLAASGDRQALALTVEARGPHGAEIDLSAHGVPLPAEGRYAADATLDRLFVALRGQRWASTQPGHLRLDRKEVAARLEIASAEQKSLKNRGLKDVQKLGLDARYGRLDEKLDVKLNGRGLDLQRLASLAQPGRDLPQTRLDVDAHLGGTKEAPTIDATVNGSSAKSARLGLDPIDVKLTARYADERATGEVQATSAGQKLLATVDLPTSDGGTRPIEAYFEIHKLSLERFKKLLPPGLALVKGTVELSARVSGTTRKPQLQAKVSLPEWQLDNLKHNATELDVTYLGNKLEAKLSSTFAQSALSKAGALSATVSALIDLSRKQRGGARLLERLEHTTPITATVNVKALDLQKLPLYALGVHLPVTAGLVDASVQLSGTLHDPMAELHVDARSLSAAGIDQIEVSTEAHYRAKEARLNLTASLHGAPLLTVRADADIDAHAMVDRLPWTNAPLHVDAIIPAYDLSRLKQLGGVVSGTFKIAGTVAHPTARGEVRADRLEIAEMHFQRFLVSGAYDGEKATARLDADESGGGSLRGTATVPAAAGAPLAIGFRAERFLLALGNNGGLGALRTLRGQLEADVHVDGPRSRPRIAGFVRLHDGALAITSDPRLYKDVTLDVGVQNGLVELKKLALKVGAGSAHASGTAQLDGLQPVRVDATAEADRFPFAQGNIGAWIDANLTLHGEQKNGQLIGTLTLKKGTAHLPKLASGKKLQSTGPLADVVFTDDAARRQREAKARAARDDAEVKADVVAHIPGPFKVRSPELMTDLKGELDVQLVGPVALLTGHVESTWGHILLLGRRYEIDRVRIDFDGQPDPDPALDVRITRQITDTTVIIEVHGTARKPQLVLGTDPPIYDQSQIIGIIISGDPGNQKISDRSTDQKVVGAISGILVNKIKDQIAPGLPIDVIKVDSGNDGYTGLGTTRIEVGKYITDSVYLSYVHQFGTPNGLRRINSNEAQVDYRFKRRYEVDTMYGDAGVGSVDFYWSWRF